MLANQRAKRALVKLPVKIVKGKVMVNAGWLTVYGKEAESDDTPSLVPVKPNETESNP